MESEIRIMRSIQDELEEQLERRNRKIFILICSASVLVAIGIFTLLLYAYLNRQYTGYQVIDSVKREDGGVAKYMNYDKKILKYSKDGVCAMDTSGKEHWNGSYEMRNPVADISGKYVLVADIGEKTACIYDGEDSGKEIDTDYPIEQACISNNGIVSIMLEEDASDTIEIYNYSGSEKKLVAEVPTNVEDGYPVAMDLSPDGASVVVAYAYMTSGKPKSRVAFYNFTKTGQDKDCLVGAKNYKDSMVGDIKFVGEDRVCLFRENGYSIWENMKQPVQTVNKSFSRKIRSAFYNQKKIGFVFDKDKTGEKGLLCLYDFAGKQYFNRTITNGYEYIRLSAHDEVLMWSSKKCRVYRSNGLEKWNCDMDVPVDELLDASGHAKYVLITSNEIEKIKLKKK